MLLGVAFYFPGMRRYPMNDFEAVVAAYGTCFFAAGCLGPSQRLARQ